MGHELTQGPWLACSAGVFFRHTNVLLAKVNVETRKEGRKWGESKDAGRGWGYFFSPRPPLFPSFALAPTLRVTIFTLPNLPPS